MSATTFVRMPTSKQLLALGVPELSEDAFGGIGPHRLTPIAAALSHKQPTLHGGGGGGLKAVVAVVAAVAIPIAAPAIASSLGVSAAVSGALGAATGVVTTAGSVIGSAIVGAGLGAVTAAATGQDIGRGALMGGISGGGAGYLSAPSQQAQMLAAQDAAFGLPSTSLTDAGATAMGYNAPVVTAPAPVTQAEMLAAQEAGFGPTQQATMLAQQEAGLGAQLSGTTQQQQMLAAQEAGFATTPETAYAYQSPVATQPTQVAGLSTTTAPIDVAQPVATPTAASTTATTTGAAGQPTSMTDRVLSGVSKVGTEITKQFSDPKKQAEMLLKAAGQIAGTYMAPEGMSPEEKALLEEQRKELETLRTTNQGLFQEKLNAARQLIGDAEYFDPEYFGLQRSRKTQLAGAAVEREQLGKIPRQRAGLREAERRRIRLGTAREAGTAFDTGYTAGMEAQVKTRQAGLNAFPTYSTTGLQYGQNLADMYGKADERQRRAVSETQKLFGSILG